MKFLKTEIDKKIIESFQQINLELYRSDTVWKISAFINFYDLHTDLELLWSQVSSVIASSYQSNLSGMENEFEKWNLYIIYLCNDKVNKALKYKIENDKFSSRKIVEDNWKEGLTEELINRIIEKHITNTDLEIERLNDVTFDEEYSSDTQVWKLIFNSPLVKGDVDKQKELLEKISTDLI